MIGGFPKKRKFKSKKASSEIGQKFFGEGTEPLTDDLINELVQNGWKESDLREYQKAGCVYSRIRNSVLSPPQFG